VSANGKRWVADIRYGSKKQHLGTYDTKQEAALAYDRKARQCGEDKPLNYKSISAEDAHTPPSKKVRPRPSSGFYGVYALRKRWLVYITYDNKKHNLGCFDTKQEAALAYDSKARSCGEDKMLNYESIEAAEDAAKQAQAGFVLVHALCAGPKEPRPRPASGFYGVSFGAKGQRWQAHIRYDGKNHYLGTFDTPEEAALVYDRAARQCEKEKDLNYENIKAAEEAAAQAQAEHIRKYPQQPKPRPSSGFYGVSACGKRWKAEISDNSKRHRLGTFDTKQEAALVYDRKARQCGEDKMLNYESIAAAEEAAVRSQAGYILVHDMRAGPKQPKPRPGSGYYGVTANRKRWTAKIRYDGKQHNLGTFDTKQEAALAYDRATRQRGDDKPLNYESIAAAEEAALLSAW
jgi:ribonucleotide monophosphatase NagD (HAD superfamily)